MNRPPQAPSRTCHDLGVCQQRTPPCRGCEPFNSLVNAPAKPVAPVQPAKPRTVWIFEVVFSKIDIILLAAVVALAYTLARS